MSRLQREIIRGLNFIMPKNPRKVLFGSFPDFSDNARALYEYMVSQIYSDNWTYVWLVKRDFITPKRKNTLFISEPQGILSWSYFKYLYHLFTAKYLFCTHSHFVEANPKRQVSVCLWHGTMLKRICAMNEREKNQPKKDQYRYFVSPSVFYNEYFCKSFLCKPEQVLACGYPRNDFLYQDTDILYELGIDSLKYKKMIVYMPTFRTPIGGGYSDASSNSHSCIDLSDSQSIKELSEYLQKKNVLLIIKWHPADIRQNQTSQLSNVISVSNKQLISKDLQTYHLLHYADALITDYSSVFCDYMVLNRPIAFDVSDMDSYADNRGFVFDNPLDFMPGYFLKTKENLLEFVDDIAEGIDKSKEKRHKLAKIYNDFEEGCASERLLNIINLKS